MENTFNPVKYSIEENKFLLANVGKPPVVALQGLDPHVNPRAVKPVLDRVYELVELQKHSGREWKGLEALKASISVYLEHADKWAKTKAKFRSAPRFPTMHSFDGRGRPHLSGPGSDSGQVTTYFDADGTRKRFEVNLVEDDFDAWKPEWIEEDKKVPEPGLTVDNEKNRIECFCGHTETFKAESAASFRAARARISKHLRVAKSDTDRHREVHTLEFGS